MDYDRALEHRLFIISADLGKVNDFTAITITERIMRRDRATYKNRPWNPVNENPRKYSREFHLRHIERPPLGTSYPDIVQRIKELHDSPQLHEQDKAIVIDITGVGQPVWDMLVAAKIMPIINGIYITGGMNESREHQMGGLKFCVPKRNLITGLQIAFQNGELQIAGGLPLRDVLVKELINFKVKININGHDQYEADREGANDDLVLSACMGYWAGMNATTATSGLRYIWEYWG